MPGSFPLITAAGMSRKTIEMKALLPSLRSAWQLWLIVLQGWGFCTMFSVCSTLHAASGRERSGENR